MKVVTSIYKHFEDANSSSLQFMRSCERLGLEVVNAFPEGQTYQGNGHVMRHLAAAFRELDEPVVYADGGDSVFLRPIRIYEDRILYSTEKQYWPPVKGIERYDSKRTIWCYLNGGGYCGPAKLLSEFFERYGLDKLDNEANGQLQQHNAYFAALADGFPIELDEECREFQTIGFMEPEYFSVHGNLIRNNLTGSLPALIHGNGRTPMGWVYDVLNAPSVNVQEDYLLPRKNIITF